jgi:hypothetical protein
MLKQVRDAPARHVENARAPTRHFETGGYACVVLKRAGAQAVVIRMKNHKGKYIR